jgi:hypothetical protein
MSDIIRLIAEQEKVDLQWLLSIAIAERDEARSRAKEYGYTGGWSSSWELTLYEECQRSTPCPPGCMADTILNHVVRLLELGNEFGVTDETMPKSVMNEITRLKNIASGKTQ